MAATADRIVLKYLGQHGEQWSCVPARDLTQADLKHITKALRGPDAADILRTAETVYGTPLYAEVKETPKVKAEPKKDSPRAKKRKVRKVKAEMDEEVQNGNHA